MDKGLLFPTSSRNIKSYVGGIQITWLVEVQLEIITIRFPCPGLQDFLRNFIFFLKTEMWEKYGS